MNSVVIREAVEQDIALLKNRLRDADAKEVIAAGNQDSEEALRQSYARSELRYTVDIDGIPAGMFGVVRSEDNTGNVWFLGTNDMAKIKKTFVKESRKVIARFLIEFQALWNYVDSRYVSSIKWLSACGAEFYDEPLQIGGVNFLAFVIRRA